MKYLLTKNLVTTFSILIALFAFNIANAAVVSMSREVPINIDGKELLQSSIRCTQSTTPRIMQREKGSKSWCSATITDYCFKGTSKINAAKNLCSSTFTKALREYEREQNPNDVVVEAPEPAPTPQQAAEPAPVEEVVETQASPNVSKANRAALIEEKMRIEEEQILIEQKQLELRAKELELKKKQLETQ